MDEYTPLLLPGAQCITEGPNGHHIEVSSMHPRVGVRLVASLIVDSIPGEDSPPYQSSSVMNIGFSHFVVYVAEFCTDNFGSCHWALGTRGIVCRRLLHDVCVRNWLVYGVLVLLG